MSGRVILGLDPGNGRTGYGVVRQTGDEVEFMECGCISTNPKHSREDRLLDLHRQERTILVVVTHSAELARTFPRRMEMNDGTLQ